MTPALRRPGDWKLLEFYEGRRLELYNLHSDLSETIEFRAADGQKAEELRDRLHGWLEAVKAQMPRGH